MLAVDYASVRLVRPHVHTGLTERLPFHVTRRWRGRVSGSWGKSWGNYVLYIGHNLFISAPFIYFNASCHLSIHIALLRSAAS